MPRSVTVGKQVSDCANLLLSARPTRIGLLAIGLLLNQPDDLNAQYVQPVWFPLGEASNRISMDVLSARSAGDESTFQTRREYSAPKTGKLPDGVTSFFYQSVWTVWRINCTRRQFMILEATYYNDLGFVTNSGKAENPVWDNPEANTVAEVVVKNACALLHKPSAPTKH